MVTTVSAVPAGVTRTDANLGIAGLTLEPPKYALGPDAWVAPPILYLANARAEGLQTEYSSAVLGTPLPRVGEVAGIVAPVKVVSNTLGFARRVFLPSAGTTNRVRAARKSPERSKANCVAFLFTITKPLPNPRGTWFLIADPELAFQLYAPPRKLMKYVVKPPVVLSSN
jgi:hypothetical protein